MNFDDLHDPDSAATRAGDTGRPSPGAPARSAAAGGARRRPAASLAAAIVVVPLALADQRRGLERPGGAGDGAGATVGPTVELDRSAGPDPTTRRAAASPTGRVDDQRRSLATTTPTRRTTTTLPAPVEPDRSAIRADGDAVRIAADRHADRALRRRRPARSSRRGAS